MMPDMERKMWKMSQHIHVCDMMRKLRSLRIKYNAFGYVLIASASLSHEHERKLRE